MSLGHFAHSREGAVCALVRSSVVAANVEEKALTDLILDEVTVGTLSYNPWDVRMGGVEGIGLVFHDGLVLFSLRSLVAGLNGRVVCISASRRGAQVNGGIVVLAGVAGIIVELNAVNKVELGDTIGDKVQSARFNQVVLALSFTMLAAGE